MIPVDILRALPLFKGLDDRTIGVVAAATTTSRIDAGDLLFQQGERAFDCFFVLQGKILVELPDGGPGGTPQVVATLEHGDLVGELALIDGGCRSANCRAGPEGAQLARLPREEFELIFNAGNELAFRLMDTVSAQVAARLRDTIAQLRRSLASDLGLGDEPA